MNYPNLKSGQWVGSPASAYLIELNPPNDNPGQYRDMAPGQLGGVFEENDRIYEIVTLDPAWLITNAAGVVVAGQLAFWVDRAKRYVTNDITACIAPAAPATCVAGLFVVGVTANATPGYGYRLCILKAGYGVTGVKCNAAVTTNTPLMGDSVAATAQVINLAGTAVRIGISRSAAAAGTCTADINITEFP